MASSNELDFDIALGKDLITVHRVIVGLNALWFYDYFLTLSDEIEYIWSGKTSFAFVLFLLNKYWPLWFILWTFEDVRFTASPLGFEQGRQFTSQLYSRCRKMVWLSMFYFVFATLFAQLAITLRVYAVTGKNYWIASCLYFISFVQVAFGIACSIYYGLHAAIAVPDIPLDEYRMCSFQLWKNKDLVYLVFSLSYDALALLIIVYSAKRYGRLAHASGIPSLLNRICQDATVYFLVLSTNHIIFLSFELFAPASIKRLPGEGLAIIMPVMISRLILSLKKTATTPDTIWSAGQAPNITFAQQTIGGTECGGDVPLRTFIEGRQSVSEL